MIAMRQAATPPALTPLSKYSRLAKGVYKFCKHDPQQSVAKTDVEVEQKGRHKHRDPSLDLASEVQ